MFKKGNRKFSFAVLFAVLFITILGVLNYLQLNIDAKLLEIFKWLFMTYIGANLLSGTTRIFRQKIGQAPESGEDSPTPISQPQVITSETTITGWQKFIFSIIVGVWACIIVTILAFSKINIDPKLSDLIIVIYTTFLAGNVLEKVQDALRFKINKPKE